MRECVNQLSIVGILKSKTVKRAVRDGVNTISLELVVQSQLSEDKINEVKVGFYAKEGSKLYNSYNTIANEYKTIAEHGTGDKIKITGSITMNEFMSQTGEFVSRNKLRGLFCNRLDANDATPHCCGAAIECIVTGTSLELKNGVPSGRKLVQAYSVGYKDSIIELKDLVLAEHLTSKFEELYTINSTGKLFIEIHNYAVKETAPAQSSNVGFGSQLSVMPDTVSSYVNEYIIIGGDMPLTIENSPSLPTPGKFTLEEIAEIKRLRNQAVQQAMTTPAAPPVNTQPTGFGGGFETSANVGGFSPVGDMPF